MDGLMEDNITESDFKIIKKLDAYGNILPATSSSVAKSFQLYLLRIIDTSKEHTDGLHRLHLLRKESPRRVI
jgi:hypothetical protein